MGHVSGVRFLVVYAQHPSGPLREELHRIMGPKLVEGVLPGTAGVFSGVLPSVAGPFSEEEARDLQARLEACEGWLGPFGGMLSFQPDLEQVVPLSVDEAEALARESLRARYGGEPPAFSWVGAFEFPRCWAFLFYQGPYIPPGMGAVVDKHTRAALGMRYVDTDAELRQRKYDTDAAPGEGRTIRPPGSRKLPKRSELLADTDRWERLPDATREYFDGLPVQVEVWRCNVTGMHLELDARYKRYRSVDPRSRHPPQYWSDYEED